MTLDGVVLEAAQRRVPDVVVVVGLVRAVVVGLLGHDAQRRRPPVALLLPLREAQGGVAGVPLVERGVGAGRGQGARRRLAGRGARGLPLAVAAAAVGGVSVQAGQGVHGLLPPVAAARRPGSGAAPGAAAAASGPTRAAAVAVGHVRGEQRRQVDGAALSDPYRSGCIPRPRLAGSRTRANFRQSLDTSRPRLAARPCCKVNVSNQAEAFLCTPGELEIRNT